MTEFGLSELELENKKKRQKTFCTLQKKFGTIEKIVSALFLIRDMYFTGKERFP